MVVPVAILKDLINAHARQDGQVQTVNKVSIHSSILFFEKRNDQKT
jgi:hypothetical protein